MDQEKGSPAAVQKSPYHSALIPGTSRGLGLGWSANTLALRALEPRVSGPVVSSDRSGEPLMDATAGE